MQRSDPTRRDFFYTSVAPFALAALPTALQAATPTAPLSKMGIAATSFSGPQKGDTLAFLEKCHSLGASGIQTHISGDIPRLRARAEELGMWMEAMTAVRRSSPEQLEKTIADAKEAGCSVARDAMLSGRRYETFNSLADWKSFVQQTHETLERVLPIFEKHKFVLAVENHKDWTADDYVKLFKTYSSEYLGACLDFGNNISLLDDPMAVAEAAAPFVKTTHLKDMAVMPYHDGFLLSEVPLGTGTLDLPRMISLVLKANPDIHFPLEMITRDPLQVPCLTDRYWVTFPERNGVYLARTLRYVENHKSSTPLPTINNLSPAERSKLVDKNIEACFRYAGTMSTANA